MELRRNLQVCKKQPACRHLAREASCAFHLCQRAASENIGNGTSWEFRVDRGPRALTRDCLAAYAKLQGRRHSSCISCHTSSFDNFALVLAGVSTEEINGDPPDM